MNNEFSLILGDKKSSSWSLRVWLILKNIGVQFDEQIIKLGNDSAKVEIMKYSPSAKVPVLRHSGNIIWESLAIAEYLNELFPAAQLWPNDFKTRAFARSISNEMHAGFTILRKMMPFSLNGIKECPHSAELDKDLKRIENIWLECRNKYSANGEYLFKSFSIADAMFAPVVLRLNTYNYQSKIPEVIDYCHTIINNKFINEWVAG